MRFLFNILVILLWLAKPVFAQQASPLRLLLTGDDSRGWEAVGREGESRGRQAPVFCFLVWPHFLSH